MIDTKARQPMQLAFNWEAEVKPQGPGARGDSVPAIRPSERPLFGEHIMEEVCAPGNMQAALKRVRANQGSPGSDGMRVEELPAYLRTHWPAIKDQLLQGTYQPQVVRRVAIPKPGSPEKRKLGIPCALDRLIQQALLQGLQPQWDPTFSASSYGFRPGRSAHQAVAQAQAYLEQGDRYVVDLDLEQIFRSRLS